MAAATDLESRRALLLSAATLTLAASLPLAGSVHAQTAPAKTQSSRLAAKKSVTKASSAKLRHQALIDAATKCGEVGEICRKHCIKLTAVGDVSIAECLRTVSAMLPICAAVAALAGQDAKRLKDLVKVCADACADCEAECRRHEFHHRECKACAESCAAMVIEAKALLAS
jgi:Cys-rich four helix bundle protein (predicted Tat secretion target)